MAAAPASSRKLLAGGEAGAAPLAAAVGLLPSDGGARRLKGTSEARAAPDAAALPEPCLQLLRGVLRVLCAHDCESICRCDGNRSMRRKLVAGLISVRRCCPPAPCA